MLGRAPAELLMRRCLLMKPLLRPRIHRFKERIVIPRGDSRLSGSGGGGQSKATAEVPFFCKKCGKTVSRKSVKHAVDVCQKCRVKK